MKLARLLAVAVALFFLAPPNALHSQEPPARKIAPIRRPPGYEELKKQAEAARRAAERDAPALLAPIPPPNPAAPLLSSTSFAGMNFGDTIGFVPPDTHAATGPDRIVQTVNTSLKIYSRTDGTPLSTTIDLNDFFNVPSTHSL